MTFKQLLEIAEKMMNSGKLSVQDKLFVMSAQQFVKEDVKVPEHLELRIMAIAENY